MDQITCFSAQHPNGLLVATIPGDPVEALKRLQMDDAVWKSDTLFMHWTHTIDYGHISRRTPLKKQIRFFPNEETLRIRQRYSQDKNRKILAWNMRREGKTFREIGFALGVTAGRASQIIRKIEKYTANPALPIPLRRQSGAY